MMEGWTPRKARMSSNKGKAKELLEGAYDLSTPEDSVAYYRAFAPHYDDVFADGLGYVYPRTLAETYLERCTETDIPVADIGCGTGAVAEHLTPDLAVDGFDISPDMIGIARTKNLYRELYEADLTGSLDHLPRDYGAVLSAGTFTHGHLGPDTLKHLLSLGRGGALFCIGINSAHYASHGFEECFADLAATNVISEPILKTGRIYQADDHEHSQATAHTVIFRLS